MPFFLSICLAGVAAGVGTVGYLVNLISADVTVFHFLASNVAEEYGM